MTLVGLDLDVSGVTDLRCLLLGGGGDALGLRFLRFPSSSPPLCLRCGGGGEDSESSRLLCFLAAAGDTSAFDFRLTGGGDNEPLEDRSRFGGGEADGDLFLLGGGGGESLGERFLVGGGDALG